MLDHKAYCYSTKCFSPIGNKRTTDGAVKDVKLSTMFCPDCGCALVWSRTKNHRKSKKKREKLSERFLDIVRA